MLSLPDFKQKQILFIQTDWETKPSLQFINDNLVFKKDNKIINRLSCSKIFCVFILGDLSITSKLIKEGLKYGISFFFLKWNFEVYGQIGAETKGNYLLRQKQYFLTETQNLNIAKNLIKQKTQNQLLLLKQQNILKTEEVKELMKKTSGIIEKTTNSQDLLGVEGNLANQFYKQYFKSIDWYKRLPRVKPDITNLLMDMGYTYLFNFTDSLLNLYGFDTYKGVYHKLFFERKSLSCDLMEPLRCIIDKQILKSYNLNQINPKDFEIKQGQIILPWKNSKKYSSLFFDTIMENKKDVFKFIRGYYHYLTLPNKKFPIFKIKIR